MKKVNFLIFLKCSVVFLAHDALAQNTGDTGPIKPANNLGDKEIVFLSWTNSFYSSENFTLKNQLLHVNSINDVTPEDKTLKETNVFGTEEHFLVTSKGDFEGDGKVEYVAFASQVGDNFPYNRLYKYQLIIPEIIQGTAELKSHIKQHIVYDKILYKPVIRTGDFDGDNDDEIVVAFITDMQKIRLEFYDMQGNDSLRIVNSVELDAAIVGEVTDKEYFDIIIGNFDGNKDEEIALMLNTASDYDYNMQLFDVLASSDTIQLSKIDEIDINTLSEFGTSINIKGLAADTDNDGVDEILFLKTMQNVSKLIQFSLVEDTESPEINLLEKLALKEYSLNYSTGTCKDIEKGDFNGDGLIDILAIESSWLSVYSRGTSNASKFKYIQGTGLSTINSANSLSVADFNSDEKDDIAILSYDIHTVNNPFGDKKQIVNASVNVLALTSPYGSTSLYSKSLLQNQQLVYSDTDPNHLFQLLAGDFSGDNFNIGKGQYYEKLDVLQPIVILNTPPTHFDIVDNETIDLNACYNGSDCSSEAFYTQTSSSQKTVEIEVTNNYTISASVSGGGTFLGIGAEAYVNTNYGVSLRNSSQFTKSFETKIDVSALEDDRIYATVTDYDIWVYPVYATFTNKYLRSIVTISPKPTTPQKENPRRAWLPGKDLEQYAYPYPHEPGNMLSYQNEIDMQGPGVAEKISNRHDDFTLTEGTSEFNVNWTEDFSQGSSTQRNVDMEIGGSISGWGIELSGSAGFENITTSTHNVSVSEGINILVDLGKIFDSQKRFSIKPYIYWNTQGAIVLDYATKVSNRTNWWNNIYGQKSDPAFIMPWRYEEEKGITDQDLVTEDLRYRTHSIILNPLTFSKGDTILVTTYVNNYSLVDLDSPVEIAFYLGSPKYGGTEIVDIDGNNRFGINSIASKEKAKVSFHWVATDDLNNLPRLYAYIDPDNSIDEIHEANNIGWIPMGKDIWKMNVSGLESIFSEEGKQNKNNDSKIYPNPVSSTATVEFSIKSATYTDIQLFDISGRKIELILQKYMPTGKYSVDLDMNNYQPGVYFYSFKTSYTSEVVKFIKN
jgi:hypothetical protein